MPFNSIHEYDAAVAGNNTDIGGSNIAEGCAPSGINNALRELARQVRAAVANQGSDIASAATTNIGAATGQYVRVTGTTAITSFGTVNAGVMRWVEFTGALTLTHNGTSLRLPGSANIVSVAGDIGLFVSLGLGNWKCLNYTKVDGSTVSSFSGTLTSTDPGATEGPDFIADRNSASPAVADVLGALVFRGRDTGANVTDYARLRAVILDPSNGSEDGNAIISALIAGVETDILKVGPGVQIGSPTGGDPGVGKINAATGYQVNGVDTPQILIVQDQKPNGTNGGTPTASAWTKHTLNTVVQNNVGASLASSVLTLPAGKWLLIGDMTSYNNGANGLDGRIQNTSDAVTLGISSNNNNTGFNVSKMVVGYLSNNSSKNIELQYFSGAATANGLGLAAAAGTNTEVYATLVAIKIG
jgi:hypothetical protein